MNEVKFKANKKDLEALNERVTALEEGGGGGTATLLDKIGTFTADLSGQDTFLMDNSNENPIIVEYDDFKVNYINKPVCMKVWLVRKQAMVTFEGVFTGNPGRYDSIITTDSTYSIRPIDASAVGAPANTFIVFGIYEESA